MTDRERVAKRPDDYTQRRRHLADLSEEQLRERFWKLTEDIVTPLVELARTHTSPSIERSVLLRMGFSSLEAKDIVERIGDQGLLGKGAGHVVLKVAQAHGLNVRDAGLALMEGNYLDDLVELMGGGAR